MQFRFGDIYRVDPLGFYVRCDVCGENFVGWLPEPERHIWCPACGTRRDPDHVHRGFRPFLVVQNQSLTPFLTTVVCLPITTSPGAKDKLAAVPVKGGPPTNLPAPESYILAWQPRTLNKANFFPSNFLGYAPPETLRQVGLWLRRLHLHGEEAIVRPKSRRVGKKGGINKHGARLKPC